MPSAIPPDVFYLHTLTSGTFSVSSFSSSSSSSSSLASGLDSDSGVSGDCVGSESTENACLALRTDSTGGCLVENIIELEEVSLFDLPCKVFGTSVVVGLLVVDGFATVVLVFGLGVVFLVVPLGLGVVLGLAVVGF